MNGQETSNTTTKIAPIEAAWVAEIVNGDEAAFEKLFRLYCQVLINFGRRFVKDKEVAENLVQDVFLKVWQNRASLDPALNIKTYLFTAVRNQALKHLRHQDILRRSDEHIKATIPESSNPEDDFAERELAESIRRAIDQLPEKCRIVFLMSRNDQLTYAQIAQIQKISIKTVETQMGRALKALRKHLINFLTFISI